jgi:hypothetical protein
MIILPTTPKNVSSNDPTDPFLCIPGGISDTGSEDHGLWTGPWPNAGFGGDWKYKIQFIIQ